MYVAIIRVGRWLAWRERERERIVVLGVRPFRWAGLAFLPRYPQIGRAHV